MMRKDMGVAATPPGHSDEPASSLAADAGSVPNALPFCTLAFNMTSKQLALGGATNDVAELRRFCERLLLLANTMEKLPGYATPQAIEARSGQTEGLDPKGESAVPNGDAPQGGPMLPDLSVHRARTQFAETVDSLRELEARLQSQRDALDSRRALADARRHAREHRAEIEAEWEALPDGRPWTLADHIAGKKL